MLAYVPSLFVTNKILLEIATPFGEENGPVIDVQSVNEFPENLHILTVALVKMLFTTKTGGGGAGIGDGDGEVGDVAT